MTRFMDQTLDWAGPIYIRLAKGYDPVVSRDELGFEIGKAIPMRVAGTGANRALIIGTGVATTRALDAAKLLEESGIDCTVLHVPTIKPLDEAAILDHACAMPLVVTVEEHTIVGGLGSAVTDTLVE